MNFDLLTPILKRLDDLEFLIKQQKNQTSSFGVIQIIYLYSNLYNNLKKLKELFRCF